MEGNVLIPFGWKHISFTLCRKGTEMHFEFFNSLVFKTEPNSDIPNITFSRLGHWLKFKFPIYLYVLYKKVPRNRIYYLQLQHAFLKNLFVAFYSSSLEYSTANGLWGRSITKAIRYLLNEERVFTIFSWFPRAIKTTCGFLDKYERTIKMLST